MPAQDVKRFRAFRVRDLLINVVPQGSGGGSAGMPGEDTITPFPTPITPVIMGAHISPRLRGLEGLLKVEQLDMQVLDQFALNIGRQLISPIVNRALCTAEMVTCPPGDRRSWYAQTGLMFETLNQTDILECHTLIRETEGMLMKEEDARFSQAQELSDDLVPMLKDAIDGLKGKR